MDATSQTGTAPVQPGLQSGSISPRTATAKQVAFLLLIDQGIQYTARLPLRVDIYPHDTTESIVSTVRNFYGIYNSASKNRGISFEDTDGHILIAQYENFYDGMDVYVRLRDELPPLPSSLGLQSYIPAAHPPRGYYNSEGYNRQPPPPPYEHQSHVQPNSGALQIRSPSPGSNRGRRNISMGNGNAANKKGRSRSSKNRSQAAGDNVNESFNGYSSGDGAPGSQASGRSREHLGNTNISLDNIVEGGRRKRPKFESSELPLFAPPQMPAAGSNHSMSPVRRPDQPRLSQSFAHPAPNPFSNPPRPLQSPQPSGYSNGYTQPNMYPTPVSDARHRGSFGFPSTSGMSSGAHVAPTPPDCTVNSCMSEEDKDVAIQLMRLGGRASASTIDDTFSGRADAASSTGATSDAESEHEMPPARKQKLNAAGMYQKIMHTTESHFVAPRESADGSGDDGEYSDSEERSPMAAPKPKAPKLKANTLLADAKPRQQTITKPKASKVPKPKMKKAPAAPGPMSPASLPDSRKQSLAFNPALPPLPGEEEQPDLSTKPRCQRCRKSKKGCDRQRPCGRCKDAGLGADECISEDEGNGRKGRYGRHMGVPISKTEATLAMAAPLLPAMPISAAGGGSGGGPEALDFANGALDKSKKRKR
ncbi:putative transcriptional regulatory protein C56F2.05c [Podospora fimiseda]|uniref:Transcriptional regulatory protein C56F2.05c n=1 Tax=Podospora fimiseda TaxID=252190 RepID=A0AAN7BII2_9PEZI|nr:putative transcriptional regulatory protein C56F2.05c [Podospora fimiseda]